MGVRALWINYPTKALSIELNQISQGVHTHLFVGRTLKTSTLVITVSAYPIGPKCKRCVSVVGQVVQTCPTQQKLQGVSRKTSTLDISMISRVTNTQVQKHFRMISESQNISKTKWGSDIKNLKFNEQSNILKSWLMHNWFSYEHINGRSLKMFQNQTLLCPI